LVVDARRIRAVTAERARVMNGGGICVHQVVEAFRLFAGLEPDLARLRRTFANALAVRDTTSRI
jgi:shikimate dehydrogenase